MIRRAPASRLGRARALLCSVAATSVVTAQTGVTQTSPLSGGAVTMTEAVLSAVRDHPLIHVTQEELNSC